MREKFGDLDTINFEKLKDLQSILRYCSGNADTNSFIQILQNLEKYLNLIFDNVLKGKEIRYSSSSYNYNKSYGGYYSKGETKKILEEIFSPAPQGIFRVLMMSMMRFGKDIKYKLSLDFFPIHAQVDIKKNQETPYIKQFFELMNFGKDCILRQGNEFFVQVTQEEYYIFVLLHCLTRHGIKSDSFYKDRYEMNDLGYLLLNSLESILQFIVFDQEAKSSLFQNFKYKLMLFIEDYTIIPTLLESSYGSAYTQSILDQGSSKWTAPTSNITIFRIFIVLLKTQQNIFYKNCVKFRHFGRINPRDESSRFSLFCARMNDFCVHQLKNWRRDTRIKLTEMGEVLLFFFNPLSLLNNIAPKMVDFEIGTIDGILDKSRTKEKENLMVQISFLDCYIRDNILVYCHLFACFLVTFSDIIDMTSDRDIDVLFEMLKIFEPKKDGKREERIFNGAITMNKFRHYVNEAVNDSPLIRRGQVDKNFIFFEKSTILTKKISRIIYTLVNRKSYCSQDCVKILEKIFKINKESATQSFMNNASTKESEQQVHDWDNRYIEKYRVFWTDPWRPNESALLYYALAVPIGHILDVFKYRIFCRKIPKEVKRPKYDRFRLVTASDSEMWWVPGTNVRFLADYKVVISWTLILFIFIVFIYGLLILINSITTPEY